MTVYEGDELIAEFCNDTLDSIFKPILHEKRFNPQSKKFHEWIDLLEFNIYSLLDDSSLMNSLKPIFSDTLTNKFYKDLCDDKDDKLKVLKLLCDWWMVYRKGGSNTTCYYLGKSEHGDLDNEDAKLVINFTINGQYIPFYLNIGLIIHLFHFTFTNQIGNIDRCQRETYNISMRKALVKTFILDKDFICDEDPNYKLYEAWKNDDDVYYGEYKIPSSEWYHYFLTQSGRNADVKYVETNLTVNTTNLQSSPIPKQSTEQILDRKLTEQIEKVTPVNYVSSEIEEQSYNMEQNTIKENKLCNDHIEILNEQIKLIEGTDSLLINEMIEIKKKLQAIELLLSKSDKQKKIIKTKLDMLHKIQSLNVDDIGDE